ncbi:MAG: hypothetical protein AAFS10_19285, partial [Myxococcota bacterium]
LDRFRAQVYGLDFRPALRYALNTCYRGQLSPNALFSEPARYHDWRLPGPPGRFDNTSTFTIERDGRLQALAGWFEATLTPKLTLSTEPGIESHWGQYMFPLPKLQAARGDQLQVRLWLDDDDGRAAEADAIWRWSGRLMRGTLELGRFDLESEQRLGRRPLTDTHPSTDPERLP